MIARIATRLDGDPVRILDVGGTADYWRQRGALAEDYPYALDITTINIVAPSDDGGGEVTSIVGDATDLRRFAPDAFHLLVSNSVIEHVRDPLLGQVTLERQAAMAREVMRMQADYYVQTPALWFPIEPHFRSPLAHPALPSVVRARELRRIRYAGVRSTLEARGYLRGVRLLTRRELASLFPDHTRLTRERSPRTGLLTKSWVVIRQR